ncbi:hypothetical protein ACFSCX_02125 [Bacillus salitolerans]|uniref:Uncharacterized protein n=1 Tax=Bacillus salitolerans TaxID=1437434 RepID=A0ABW4LJS3_9BACI
MSKRKEIHVDKLIIKADEVIIIDENKRRYHRDPWIGRVREVDVDDDKRNMDVESVAEEKVDVESLSEAGNEERPRFRWF